MPESPYHDTGREPDRDSPTDARRWLKVVAIVLVILILLVVVVVLVGGHRPPAGGHG